MPPKEKYKARWITPRVDHIAETQRHVGIEPVFEKVSNITAKLKKPVVVEITSRGGGFRDIIHEVPMVTEYLGKVGEMDHGFEHRIDLKKLKIHEKDIPRIVSEIDLENF